LHVFRNVLTITRKHGPRNVPEVRGSAGIQEKA
jgi:hypothetical protein